MAKMKKRKLCWEASGSPQVIGYRLYWAESGKVDYSSSHVTLGNVTEIVLPDDLDGFDLCGGCLVFGVSALDELGNESDIITLDVPYQFDAPERPGNLWIETLEEYYTSNEDPVPKKQSGPIPLFERRQVPDVAERPETTGAESEYEKTSLKYIRGRDSN